MNNGFGYAPAYHGDFEGYNTLIIQETTESILNLRVSYIDEVAKLDGDGKANPSDLENCKKALKESLAWRDEKQL